VSEIRILPLYPQYSSSATGSVQEKIFELVKKDKNIPSIKFLLPFFDHPGFVKSFAEIGRPQLDKFKPDHVLFSFHGLPERQILKGDLSGTHCLQSEDCCEKITPTNALCYRAHCFATARAIAKELSIDPMQYTICFQSRLGRTPWIQPFTDHVIEELALGGKKHLVVFCPSFVADCLETLEEISIRANDQFLQHGGEALQLIPSLNEHPLWVETVANMVRGEASPTT
jgi:ferrochelatase